MSWWVVDEAGSSEVGEFTSMGSAVEEVLAASGWACLIRLRPQGEGAAFRPKHSPDSEFRIRSNRTQPKIQHD